MYKFSWIDDEYLGGNMIAVYGQLDTGDYFYTNDSVDGVWFLDANPKEMMDYWEDDYWYTWLEDHAINVISNRKYYNFWIDLFKHCKRTGYRLDGYSDLDYAIAAFKEERDA